MDYDVIVFDTAPTGHTLRLLNFPTLLEKGLAKLMQLKGTVGSMMGQVGSWQHTGMTGSSCCGSKACTVQVQAVFQTESFRLLLMKSASSSPA
jgi:anion-transporting  ArsA/GET3 family ATPase